MVIDDLQEILGPNVSTNLLSIYVRRAVTLITNYLNISTVAIIDIDIWTHVVTTIEPIDVSVTYADAVVEYATLCYRKKGNEGLKQFSQGNRSGTYEDALPTSVKELLPLPYAQMLSTSRYGDTHVM